MKKIAFGCDHVGFILKQDILTHLTQRGITVIDKGTRVAGAHGLPALCQRGGTSRCLWRG